MANLARKYLARRERTGQSWQHTSESEAEHREKGSHGRPQGSAASCADQTSRRS